MRYEQTTYEPRPVMPRAAAVSILTGGSKLTARVRNRCLSALEQVTPSRHPISVLNGVRMYDTDVAPKPYSQKVAGRMRSVAFARLWRLLRRLDRRSRAAHNSIIRAGSLRTEGLRVELQARLQTQLDKLKEVRQLVENEILSRRKMNQ